MSSGRKEPAPALLAVRPELDARIRDLVMACTRHRINFDYSKALNMLVELGSEWLEECTQSDRKKVRKVFGAHLNYRKFERSGALADWREFDELRRWKRKARELKNRST